MKYTNEPFTHQCLVNSLQTINGLKQMYISANRDTERDMNTAGRYQQGDRYFYIKPLPTNISLRYT
jgi:hypothetical protein